MPQAPHDPVSVHAVVADAVNDEVDVASAANLRLQLRFGASVWLLDAVKHGPEELLSDAQGACNGPRYGLMR
ncbi:MAG: hypothetical protein QW566_00145 [Candidatus Jordarchaeales archaeon]